VHEYQALRRESSLGTTALDLQQLFSEAGGIASVDLVVDKLTGRSRGFAFVTMDTPEGAQAAIAKLQGHDLSGRKMTVSEARPPAAGRRMG
jgi:cold-inducible RNA-binding protein